MSVNHITQINELPENFKSELKHFFANYKTLINKKVVVNDFKSREEAVSIIETALSAYKTKYAK